MSEANTSWWNTFTLEPETSRRFEIGTLQLFLERRELDWAIGHRWDDSADVDRWSTEPLDGFPDDLDENRYVVESSLNEFRLNALTADRAVVARPRKTLRILDGLSIQIYVGSPLWVGVALGKQNVGLELPTRQLKETFFGSNTRSGELAYGLRTNARLELGHLTPAPHQLVTPVLIENRSGETLTIDRLNLPVPFLSVFAGEPGLWSEQVRFVAEDSSSLARFEVLEGPPSHATGERISKPRRTAPAGHLFRAFSSILGL